MKTDMQRLGDTIRELGKNSSLGFALIEARVLSAWQDIVGEAIRENTNPHKMKNGILFVKTKSPSWAQELKAISPGIKSKINGAVGANVLREIIFLHDGGIKKNYDYNSKESPVLELDLEELSTEEMRQIDALVFDIRQDDLRQWITRVLIKDKKLNKWRDKRQRY